MASETHGSILLSTADSVSRMLMKKLDSETGLKPSEWTDSINLLGALPIRTASGTIAHFEDGAEDVPMKSVVATITPIQEGTGDPSPSNPRPISGTDELTLTKTGKNLFDKKPFSDWVTKSPYMVLDDNLPKNALLTMVFIDKDTSVDISGCYLGFVKDTYNGGTVQNTDFHWTLQNGAVRGRTDNVAEVGTDLCNYLMMYPTNEATYNKIFSRFDIMILAGAETATTYEPYTGTTYTVNLGRTVYGGSAEVVGGVGESTHGKLDLSSLEWTYSSTYQRFSTTSQVAGIKTPPNNNTVANILCSHFNADTSNNTAEVGKDNIIGVSMTGVIQIRDTSLNGDISALMTLLENVDFVYELATPTDFTFTGQPIDSYLGVNNIWCDSGEVLDVEYRADMNLLISELGG